jgi:hypothetical protein
MNLFSSRRTPVGWSAVKKLEPRAERYAPEPARDSREGFAATLRGYSHPGGFCPYSSDKSRSSVSLRGPAQRPKVSASAWRIETQHLSHSRGRCGWVPGSFDLRACDSGAAAVLIFLLFAGSSLFSLHLAECATRGIIATAQMSYSVSVGRMMQT